MRTLTCCYAGVVLIFLTTSSLRAQSIEPAGIAFPGAEGAGKFTTGGRGGQIVHVTTLAAEGPGSLADAVSHGDRIIVFDVSGVIDLTVHKKGETRGGRIIIEHPNITIAGQTASGEGICLRGGMLQVSADNVIVRYLRSRRGWICQEDTGDCIVAEPRTSGERAEPSSVSQQAFDKVQEKKRERGKFIHSFEDMANVVIDHCSTSWATDENLSVTHVDRSTVSWCIAAEGCDYANPKQTPPNHSEGSLWGSAAPDGRSTMHHMLYAHNRLRNPRTTAGADVPPVLNLYNSVVYNWSEYASHTGNERVFINLLNNYYKAGPDTPADKRSVMFEFHGDPGARLHARGNVVESSAKATTDNRLAVGHSNKFRHASDSERAAMIVDTPFADAQAGIESAAEAWESVFADVGATLPSRDAVDLRIVTSVRDGRGRVIEKETDLPEDQRWPDYRTLPPLEDRDADGLPDFWEKQFGLDRRDAADASNVSHGYANIEHYFNSTDPTGDDAPIVFVAATVSRATSKRPGQWRIIRNGSTKSPLTVAFKLSGDAKSVRDYEPIEPTVTIPAGQRSAMIELTPLSTARDDRTVIMTLVTDGQGCNVGCPAQSLIVIRAPRDS